MPRPHLFLVLLPALLSAPVGGDDTGKAWLREGLLAACRHPAANGETLATAMDGSRLAGDELINSRGLAIGWRRDFDLPDGARLRIERLQPGGRLRRLSVEYHESADDGEPLPVLAAIAGGDCDVLAARRLVYREGDTTPLAIAHLDRAFEPMGATEPLDPPVPPGDDPGGVAVALVDAGVNYLLPEIRDRLARDADGAIIGFDFWDMDDRPFDANPANSPFFPQRHGTRTASLLLREAPAARIVPYRYPRPDMARMTDVIRHADDNGVIIMNLSLGSNRREEWQPFAEAASGAPHMLFVVSAGNNGRDIDAEPVYPAALALDNMITVTSSEHTGALAQGSNRGATSVDVLVPGEGVIATEFDGDEIPVFGSSYAAVRVSALAARLLAENPLWRAGQLKRAILARTLPPLPGEENVVAHGFLPRPAQAERIAPISRGDEIRETARREIDAATLYDQPVDTPAGFALSPTFAVFSSTRWHVDDLVKHARQAAGILAQCDIVMPHLTIRELDGSDAYRYFRDDTAQDMLSRVPMPRPAVFFVRHTLQDIAFEAEAIGRGNSAGREGLIDTVWIIEDARDPGIIIAHELVHLLVDNGRHVDIPGNLMRDATAPDNVELTAQQCEEIVTAGVTNGLLRANWAHP